MMQTRRECLIRAASAAAGLAISGKGQRAEAAERTSALRVGMCDWSLGRSDPGGFALAREIGLDGIEVSIGYPKDNLRLRQPAVQRQYLDAARESGLAIPSVAMGLLNDVPLMSEPHTALWVADTIDAAKALGARCILLAFFGKGELREENKEDMRRVTEVLKELAPRAEKAGVVLGIESYLRAEAVLGILEQVKSRFVQVYYDFYNLGVTRKCDVVKEVRLLGRDRICQVHFKEGPHLLGRGKVLDWPAIVATLKEIGYDGWVVLETSSPNGVLADTRANLQYVKDLFGRAG